MNTAIVTSILEWNKWKVVTLMVALCMRILAASQCFIKVEQGPTFLNGTSLWDVYITSSSHVSISSREECEKGLTLNDDEILSLSIEGMNLPCGNEDEWNGAQGRNYIQIDSRHLNSTLTGKSWCGNIQETREIFRSQSNIRGAFKDISIKTRASSSIPWSVRLSFRRSIRRSEPEEKSSEVGGNVTFECYDAVERNEEEVVFLEHAESKKSIFGFPSENELVSIDALPGRTVFTLRRLNVSQAGIYNCSIKRNSANNLQYQSYRLILDEVGSANGQMTSSSLHDMTPGSKKSIYPNKEREEVNGRNQTIDLNRGRDNKARQKHKRTAAEEEGWDFQSSSLKSELMTSKLNVNLTIAIEKETTMTTMKKTTTLEKLTTETVAALTTYQADPGDNTTPAITTSDGNPDITTLEVHAVITTPEVNSVVTIPWVASTTPGVTPAIIEKLATTATQFIYASTNRNTPSINQGTSVTVKNALYFTTFGSFEANESGHEYGPTTSTSFSNGLLTPPEHAVPTSHLYSLLSDPVKTNTEKSFPYSNLATTYSPSLSSFNHPTNRSPFTETIVSISSRTPVDLDASREKNVTDSLRRLTKTLIIKSPLPTEVATPRSLAVSSIFPSSSSLSSSSSLAITKKPEKEWFIPKMTASVEHNIFPGPTEIVFSSPAFASTFNLRMSSLTFAESGSSSSMTESEVRPTEAIRTLKQNLSDISSMVNNQNDFAFIDFENNWISNTSHTSSVNSTAASQTPLSSASLSAPSSAYPIPTHHSQPTTSFPVKASSRPPHSPLSPSFEPASSRINLLPTPTISTTMTTITAASWTTGREIYRSTTTKTPLVRISKYEIVKVIKELKDDTQVANVSRLTIETPRETHILTPNSTMASSKVVSFSLPNKTKPTYSLSKTLYSVPQSLNETFSPQLPTTQAFSTMFTSPPSSNFSTISASSSSSSSTASKVDPLPSNQTITTAVTKPPVSRTSLKPSSSSVNRLVHPYPKHLNPLPTADVGMNSTALTGVNEGRFDVAINTTTGEGLTQQDARMLFILIAVCCVATIFAALFIAFGCMRKRDRAAKAAASGAPVAQNQSDDTKSITSLSIVRHPAEYVEDSSKRGKKKEKGKGAPFSPQTNPSAMEEDYGWVFSAPSTGWEPRAPSQQISNNNNDDYADPMTVHYGKLLFRGDLTSGPVLFVNHQEWSESDSAPTLSNVFTADVASKSCPQRSILSEKSDSAAALTSFTAPPSETKDWMMTLTKEHRPTKEPRPEKDSELYWERNIESCVDVNGRETDDDDDDKTKDEGSTGSDISEELDEEEGEERDEGGDVECGRGDVVLDFQSEGGSFKNSAGSRFERNWRSESEKMTGSSYV